MVVFIVRVQTKNHALNVVLRALPSRRCAGRTGRRCHGVARVIVTQQRPRASGARIRSVVGRARINRNRRGVVANICIRRCPATRAAACAARAASAIAERARLGTNERGKLGRIHAARVARARILHAAAAVRTRHGGDQPEEGAAKAADGESRRRALLIRARATGAAAAAEQSEEADAERDHAEREQKQTAARGRASAAAVVVVNANVEIVRDARGRLH